MTPNKHLLVIDATALLFRMYFAKSRHQSVDGTEVGGVVGVSRAVVRLIQEHNPKYVAVVFDAAQRTFRNALLPTYKANRGEPPEDLIPQFELTFEAIKALGFAVFRAPGFEADDIIATFAKMAVEQQISATLVSDDKDISPLVRDETPTVSQWIYSKKKRMCSNDIFEKYGVYPHQMVDYLSLIGDSSDNIPGIRGVGPKSASLLLQHMGTLEEIFQRIDEIPSLPIRGAKSLFTKVQIGKEQAMFAKSIIVLRDDVPLELSSLESLEYIGPSENADAFFEQMSATYPLRWIRTHLG